MLVHVLERTLALLHPFMPFVTEEIWSLMPGERGLLAASPWPEADESRRDEQAEAAMDRVIEAVAALRRYRDDVGAQARRRRSAACSRPTATPTLRDHVGRLARFELVGPTRTASPWRRSRSRAASVEVFASEGLDAEAEGRRARGRARAQLDGEIERLEGSSPTRASSSKAPAEVVEEERDKLERLPARRSARLDEA